MSQRTLSIKEILRTNLFGILFTIIIGTLMHFVYDFSGQNSFVGLFSPVNESVWEHLKLLFFPFLLFSIYEYFKKSKPFKNYLIAKALGVLVGMLFIVVIFYLYSGIVGHSLLPVDILTFIIAVFLSFFISNYMMQRGCLTSNSAQIIGGLLIILILVLFVHFSYAPPKLPLFQDPTINDIK